MTFLYFGRISAAIGTLPSVRPLWGRSADRTCWNFTVKQLWLSVHGETCNLRRGSWRPVLTSHWFEIGFKWTAVKISTFYIKTIFSRTYFRPQNITLNFWKTLFLRFERLAVCVTCVNWLHMTVLPRQNFYVYWTMLSGSSGRPRFPQSVLTRSLWPEEGGKSDCRSCRRTPDGCPSVLQQSGAGANQIYWETWTEGSAGCWLIYSKVSEFCARREKNAPVKSAGTSLFLGAKLLSTGQRQEILKEK